MTPYLTELRVYYKDTDAAGVVYYANYLKFLEVARTEYLRDLGLAVEGYLSQGIQFAVVEVHVKYKSPARYGELLQISTEVEELRAASFTLRHTVWAGRHGLQRLAVYASTRLGCINSQLKPMRLPGELRIKLQGEITIT